jgi:transposase
MDRQEPLDRLRRIWSLQGFAVTELDIERLPRRNGNRCIKIVRLRDERPGGHSCPECDKLHKEGLFQESEERRWRDRSLGDFDTYVAITPWRVACCGGTRVEAFPWEAPGHRMTRRFFELIAALCRRLPVIRVAAMARLSWDTVARIDKASIALALGDGPSLDGLRWIGVDEVSRTGGRVYFTIVTNLCSGEVVWIGDGKGEEALAAFFRKLGRKRCRKIRGAVSDLGRGYLAAIAAYIPQAVHLLDRFHIIQWVNEALNKIRREIFGAAPRDDLGRGFKVKKWLLLRAYEALKLGDKRLLGRLLTRNRKLQRAYLLKEQLRGVLHYPWIYLGALRRNLLSWCHIAIRSRLKPLKQIGYRLREHIDKITAAYQHAVPMGLVEAINRNIGLLRRQAHGYRDVEYFKLKIYQRCSLRTDPYAHVVL